MSKVFLDTNVLVYASDGANPAKQRAIECMLTLEKQRVLSTQILQEFYVVATRKLGVTPPEAKSRLRSLHQLETVLVDRVVSFEAIDCSAMDQLSFWDAFVVRGRTSELFRDLDRRSFHGQYIRGVQVINPFN